MLETFVSKIVKKNKRKGILKEAAEHFLRPAEELKKEIDMANLRHHIQNTKANFFSNYLIVFSPVLK